MATRALRGMLGGDGLRARLLRSSGFTVLGYGTSQLLRLASNLVLTRLLFPEAFGMMVLVSIFMMGLGMFSDLGIGPSIQQNRRGDDPDFLDTAWTIQVGRGVILWLAALLLAWPMAWFYGEPLLLQLLPVGAVAMLITAFAPTRVETANRHLMLGRLTVIDLVSQSIGILAAIVLAWLTGSVWALVLSGIVSAAAHLLGWHLFLPGRANRLRWEPEAASELIRFGKWIFLSTIAGFLLSQGDKIVLGKYLSLELLGIYNIGYFLASFPLLLGGLISRRVLIPLYREKPPADSRANFEKLRQMRMVLSAGTLGLVLVVALAGVWLVEVLYDPRYARAGGVVVLVALMQIPALIAMTYDQAALAAGDSRRFFVLAAARAALTITLLLLGVELAGLAGALIGQGLAMVLAHPVVIWLARRQGAWDGLHDALFAVAGLAVAAVALWLNQDAVAMLLAPKMP